MRNTLAFIVAIAAVLLVMTSSLVIAGSKKTKAPQEPFEVAVGCPVIPFVDCPVPLSMKGTVEEWNRAYCKNATSADQCCSILKTQRENSCKMAQKNQGSQQIQDYRNVTANLLKSYKPSSCTYKRDVEELKGMYYHVTRYCDDSKCNPNFLATSHFLPPALMDNNWATRDPSYVKVEVVDQCKPKPDYVDKVCRDKASTLTSLSQSEKDNEINECIRMYKA